MCTKFTLMRASVGIGMTSTRSIVISGWYGQRNVGDEAMLEVLERVSARFGARDAALLA